MGKESLQFSLSITHSSPYLLALISSFIKAVLVEAEHDWMMVSDLSGDVIIHQQGRSVKPINPNAILIAVSESADDESAPLTMPLTTQQVVTCLDRCGAELIAKLDSPQGRAIADALLRTAHDIRAFTSTIEQAIGADVKQSADDALEHEPLINDLVIQPKQGAPAFTPSQVVASEPLTPERLAPERDSWMGNAGNTNVLQFHTAAAQGFAQLVPSSAVLIESSIASDLKINDHAVGGIEAQSHIMYRLLELPTEKLLSIRPEYKVVAHAMLGKALTLVQVSNVTNVQLQVCQEFIQAVKMMGICQPEHMQADRARGLFPRMRQTLNC